jgi:hypothetical protein
MGLTLHFTNFYDFRKFPIKSIDFGVGVEYTKDIQELADYLKKSAREKFIGS